MSVKIEIVTQNNVTLEFVTETTEDNTEETTTESEGGDN